MDNSKNLLIQEYPLVVLPSLAKVIGLNKSIVLQQIHYWLQTSQHIYNDKKWVYNSYDEWHKQFTFWSIKTIKRIILSLEKDGLVISDNFNKLKIDRTKWYSINYDKLSSIVSNCPHVDEVSLTQPIPETTENTNTPPTSNDAEVSKKPTQQFKENSEAYKLSSYLLQKIRANDPNFKQPNLQKWAVTIDRLIRLDKRDPKLIKAVIDFATTDDFWKSNILSANKLRKQFTTLMLRGNIKPAEKKSKVIWDNVI